MDKNTIKKIASIGILVIIIIIGGISLTKNLGKSQKVVNKEEATKKIERYAKDINAVTAKEVKSAVDYTSDNVKELPNIKKNEVTVKPNTELYVEIFASPEKSGTQKDGWLNEVAENFNKAGNKVNGKPVSVKIRNVSSGLGTDYISSGTYVPDAFTPSADCWIKMLESSGVHIEKYSNSLVTNYAGILLTDKKEKELLKTCKTIDAKAIIEATSSGEFVMGYTNPYTSTTGLNFLTTALQTYDEDNLLSEKAVKGFQKFQKNVPFVSYTTTQMRDAAEKGTFDGFVLEYQLYVNDASLSRKYNFHPFGSIHNNPLYAVKELSAEKKEILRLFAEYATNEKNQQLAKEYGYNADINYNPKESVLDGNVLLSAQELWKEEKDSQPILAVFITDISGSMGGEPLNALKTSLINSMPYISQENYIGLVSYNDEVTINLPIGKFDMKQQSKFKGAVESLSEGGGTATNDAVIVATDMLLKAKEKYPDAKMMLFVLSDGETNCGYSLEAIKDSVKALSVPIYTIGYNADIPALQEMSNINEAASINADSDDVVYQLKNLFNSNL